MGQYCQVGLQIVIKQQMTPSLIVLLITLMHNSPHTISLTVTEHISSNYLTIYPHNSNKTDNGYLPSSPSPVLHLLSYPYFMVEVEQNQTHNFTLYSINIHNCLFVSCNSILPDQSSLLNQFLPPSQLLVKEGIHAGCGASCRWKVAVNGTTLRLVVVEKDYFEPVRAVKVTVVDTGYNMGNPSYIVWLPEHYTMYMQEVELGVSTDGQFYLLLGNNTHYSVFYTSLWSIQPIILHQPFSHSQPTSWHSDVEILPPLCQKGPTLSLQLYLTNESFLTIPIHHTCIITTNQTSNTSQIGQNITEENITKVMLFPDEVYKNVSLYRTYYADMLMNKKLPILFPQIQLSEEECQLQYKDINNVSIPIGIIFPQKQWSMCRVSLTISSRYVIFSNSTVQKPYKLASCMISVHDNPHKCVVSEQVLDRNYALISPYFYRLYIVNQGQTYDLSLVDLTQREIENIRNSFIIITITAFIVTFLICLGLCCKYSCLFLFQYYGFIQQQPRYVYPLSYLQLRLRMRRLEQASYLRYKIKQSSRQETCCFCLDDLKREEKVVQLYCRHVFHAGCFQGWVRNEQDARCPVCKRGFTSVEIQLFRNSNSTFKDIDMIDI